VSVRRGIVFSLVLAAGLRFLWPLADPPPQLSWSSGVYSDPAAKTLPARHAIEKGDWSFEQSPYVPVFPLANGLAWLTFRSFGSGRLPWQILSTFASLAGLVAVVLALRRRVGERAALLAAIVGGASFWLGMFARAPVVENWVAALLAWSCYFALGRGPAERASAGVLAAIAVLFGKYHAVAFWPGLLAFGWLERRNWRDLTPVAAGAAAVLLPWFAFVFLPHRIEITTFVGHVATGMQGPPSLLRSPVEALLDPFHAVRQAWVFHQAPVAGIVGGFFVVWTVASARRLKQRVETGTALFAFWCLGVWVYYGLLSYQAPRYYVAAGLGLVGAAAAQLDEWWAEGSSRWRWSKGLRANVVALVGLYFFGIVPSIPYHLPHSSAPWRRSRARSLRPTTRFGGPCFPRRWPEPRSRSPPVCAAGRSSRRGGSRAPRSSSLWYSRRCASRDGCSSASSCSATCTTLSRRWSVPTPCCWDRSLRRSRWGPTSPP
jgi:hypothetical protein